MFVIYAYILAMAVKQKRKIYPVNLGLPSDVKLLQVIKHTKATTTLSLVVGIFILCFVLMSTAFIAVSNFDGDWFQNRLWIVYILFAVLFFCCSSFVNPLIYFWRLKEFNRAYRTLFRCKILQSEIDE